MVTAAQKKAADKAAADAANAAAGNGAGDQQSPDPEVQAKVDNETDRGLRGIEVDQTPNENYTVAGQVAGKPVPETDADTKAAATK